MTFNGLETRVATTGVTVDAMLEDACEAMARARVDRLAVAQSGRTCGFITESDILRHVSQNGGLSDTPVAMLMRLEADA